jgi:hypothetical protein
MKLHMEKYSKILFQLAGIVPRYKKLEEFTWAQLASFSTTAKCVSRYTSNSYNRLWSILTHKPNVHKFGMMWWKMPPLNGPANYQDCFT